MWLCSGRCRRFSLAIHYLYENALNTKDILALFCCRRQQRIGLILRLKKIINSVFDRKGVEAVDQLYEHQIRIKRILRRHCHGKPSMQKDSNVEAGSRDDANEPICYLGTNCHVVV